MTTTKGSVKNLIIAALCVALGLVLPSVFHLLGSGSVFLPMHIPVLLCGLICGWRYGALCGFIVPLLSSILTGMPPLFPVAPAMMLELAAYGALTGLLYRKLGQNIYVSMLGAMLAGRIVSGVANVVLMGVAGRPYGLSAFLTASFVTSLPGIAIQLISIPLLVVSFQRAGLIASPARKKQLGGSATPCVQPLK